MRHLLLPGTALAALGVALLQGVCVRAQLSPDREPPGPSSRKTGLVITEIMYHPQPAPDLTNRLQFVELYNSKSWAEDLSGFSLDGSVHYLFPSNTVLRPAAFLVVARDPDYLKTVYGVTNVTGPWDGAETNGLSIDRDTVRLRNRQGAVLLEVNYSDAPPWPVSADGSGHSLVLARPSFGENDSRAWAQSDVAGGSPGRADPVGNEPLASVVINEWIAHTDTPVRDAIELYNHGNTAVDLSGAYLSDSPDTNRFRIPAGTVIAPRGFLAFDDTVMGFSLFAEGETVFFVNSNQTRVIDAINFKGMSNGVSAGRYPNGGPLHYNLASRTFGASNSAPKRFAVVINELMYNPISGDSNEEYVELYNRNTQAANIGLWSLTNGVNFTFPAGATMPPGAYWVVAKHPTNLMSIYTNLTSSNTFGPYNGTLANGGERVSLSAADYDRVVIGGQTMELRLNVIASEVVYGDGGQWGDWSDGGGASLELIDPEADTYLPSNWADSDDSGESQWTAVEYNGPLGETLGSKVNDRLILMLQGVGECLVDEVEVRVNNGPNLVVNGGFESGLEGWRLQGSHDFSSLDERAFAGSHSLHLRAGSRGDNQSNRILSPPLAGSVPADATRVSIRAKARWVRGHPEILLRLHGGGAEAYGAMALPRKLGTPGQVNSRRVANAGPAIYDVAHAPLLPAALADVVVTARASDPQGIGAMTLRYRLDPSPDFLEAAMRDDGESPDAVANDGLYSALIPGQPAGQMVAFHLESRDRSGGLGLFPHRVFPPAGLDRCWPVDAVTREGVIRWGETQMPGDFATYHLWVTAANSNRWHTRDAMNNTELDGTFVYNNARAVYNALPLFSGSPWHRTNSTTGPAGPNRVDYEMNFPDDDPMLGATDFILNNPGNADVLTISDLSAMAEQAVYRIMEGMGLVQNHRRYVHFFVNGSQRSTAYERPGNFIFEDSQQPNGDMIEQWFPESAGGQLFKVEDWFEFEDNGFDIAANNDADLQRRVVTLEGRPTLVPAPYRFMFRKRSVAVGSSANDYTPIFELIDAISPAENPTNSTVNPQTFGERADWEQWMRVFAVQRAVGNWDSYGWARGKNDYWYQPAGGRFQHLTWDIDYSMGLGRPWDAPLFESNDPRVSAMFNTPEIVRAYWRAFADLVGGAFSNAALDPFLDTRAAALQANQVNIDPDAVAAIKTFIGRRREFLQSQLATVTAPFAVLGAAAFETTNNLAILTLSVPIGIVSVTLNAQVYPVSWINTTSCLVRVPLNPGLNKFTLGGQDRAGQPAADASQLILANYSGPPAEPAGAFIISEILFAPEIPGAQFVELVNRSPFSFDLEGWQLEGTGFTFPFGSIITNGQRLVLTRDRDAFRAAYGSVPLFGVFNRTLPSGGQRLALLKPEGTSNTIAAAVRYESGAPWPAAAPGLSLQVIDLTQDNGRAANWAVDAGARSTPGAPNSVAAVLAPFDPIWLNEVQVESVAGTVDNWGEPSPWIELYNAGSATVSLDGYRLADNFTNLLQWPFPLGSTLAPGEHRVLWADGEEIESDDAILHTNFRLERKGQVALVRLLGGEQPQITDHLVWSRVAPDLSLGPVPEGQPAYRALLQTPTPGAPNVKRTPAVMINEWMAKNTTGSLDPADLAHDDWFELYNAEPFPVDLGGYYLTDSLGNPTKYQVPANGQYVVPADGYLLVWADNSPAQNRADRRDLHVNFQLSTSYGALALYAPDGITPVDLLTYLQQTNDISEGRFGDGADPRYFMTNATPRLPNSIVGICNSPPAFPPPTNQYVVPGQNLNYVVRASDPDRPVQGLFYSTNDIPPGATILGTGVFRWLVPTNQPLGEYAVSIGVRDNGQPPLTDTLNFTVTVRLTNAPVTEGQLLIREPGAPDGQFTLAFDTTPGRVYRVLCAEDISAPVWAQLGPDFVAANPTASFTDRSTVPQRFYRVIELP